LPCSKYALTVGRQTGEARGREKRRRGKDLEPGRGTATKKEGFRQN